MPFFGPAGDTRSRFGGETDKRAAWLQPLRLDLQAKTGRRRWCPPSYSASHLALCHRAVDSYSESFFGRSLFHRDSDTTHPRQRSGFEWRKRTALVKSRSRAFIDSLHNEATEQPVPTVDRSSPGIRHDPGSVGYQRATEPGLGRRSPIYRITIAPEAETTLGAGERIEKGGGKPWSNWVHSADASG